MSITLQAIQFQNLRSDLPKFRAGDTVKVNYKIVEGDKERIQPFQGVVIQVRGAGVSTMFTVRKLSGNVAVERIFPMHSPRIASLEVVREGLVRRARIFYMRELTGKATRIKDRSTKDDRSKAKTKAKAKAKA
ncbi:MAG: 50S ribosomal protein L19 [Fibrobacterota bacterium]|nr:50S ribosomal protein L19 [Fibrobacterota bacterium]QQS07384.1 MAG: 50S ribosomal protein L19 [Fibrobacterota bacterium]